MITAASCSVPQNALIGVRNEKLLVRQTIMGVNRSAPGKLMLLMVYASEEYLQVNASSIGALFLKSVKANMHTQQTSSQTNTGITGTIDYTTQNNLPTSSKEPSIMSKYRHCFFRAELDANNLKSRISRKRRAIIRHLN